MFAGAGEGHRGLVRAVGWGRLRRTGGISCGWSQKWSGGPILDGDGAEKDVRFWKLCQSLSGLYRPGTDEKCWIDGVLAMKMRLGV